GSAKQVLLRSAPAELVRGRLEGLGFATTRQNLPFAPSRPLRPGRQQILQNRAARMSAPESFAATPPGPAIESKPAEFAYRRWCPRRAPADKPKPYESVSQPQKPAPSRTTNRTAPIARR